MEKYDSNKYLILAFNEYFYFTNLTFPFNLCVINMHQVRLLCQQQFAASHILFNFREQTITLFIIRMSRCMWSSNIDWWANKTINSIDKLFCGYLCDPKMSERIVVTTWVHRRQWNILQHFYEIEIKIKIYIYINIYNDKYT